VLGLTDIHRSDARVSAEDSGFAKNTPNSARHKLELIFWCSWWSLLLLVSAIFLQDRGPVYPLRVRQRLSFQAGAAPDQRPIVVIADVGRSLQRNCRNENDLQLLKDCKEVAHFAPTEYPAPGQFTVFSNVLLWSVDTKSAVNWSNHIYELSLPLQIPPSLKITAALGLIWLVVSPFAFSIWCRRRTSIRLSAVKASELVSGKQSKSGLELDVRSSNPSTVFWLNAILGTMAVFGTLYVSTGSLTPLNLFGNCLIREGIPFFTNCDHMIHQSIFDFLDGRAPAIKMLLRRVLFPLICFPLMKCYGFAMGGLLGSFILNISASLLFSFYCLKRYGNTAAFIALWLIAFYPGMAYWGGLPYVYSFIVPGSLAMIVLLTEIELSPSQAKVAVLALLLGVLNLGYDFFVFIVPALAGVLFWQKRYKLLPLALLATIAPTLLWCAILSVTAGREAVSNANTTPYVNAVVAYTLLRDPAVLLANLQQLPGTLLTLLRVFFYSTFYYLPTLFACTVIAFRPPLKMRFLKCEATLMLGALVLFLFLNCAPDLPNLKGLDTDWQLKGDWIARIYMPVFVAYVSFIARAWSEIDKLNVVRQSFLYVITAGTILGNVLVCYGPLFNNPFSIASRVYHDFYMHAKEPMMQQSLRVFGRKPIGFFDTERALKNCNSYGQMLQ
jgi:hypothetical protein